LTFAESQNDVFYQEIDVVNIMHDSLLHVLGVEKHEVFSWPVTVVMQNGQGHQVTGPNQVYFVKRIVNNFWKPGSSPVQNGVQEDPNKPATPAPVQPAQPAQPATTPVVPKPAPAQNATQPAVPKPTPA